MKLTRQQRHMAYMIMLAEAESGVHENYGLCRLIGDCLDESATTVRFSDLGLADFTELWAKRPFTVNSHWFPCTYSGWQSRIALLKQCITETEDAWPK